ncbi:MAG: guanylate kinase, partial [Clostridia bacterium]|nr:guanylate kinase [Clostridia bacterium]
RQGEVDGKDYYFIDRETFTKRIDENAFLEHAEFSGNFYGTPRDAVLKQLEAGHDMFLEIEVQGALQVMEKMPECVSIFILPPSFEVLEQRLRGRGTESDEVVKRRLAQAERELPMADKYMYQIVNDTVEDTYQKLRSLYLKHSLVVHEMYEV